MRFLSTILLAGILAIATAFVALAQESVGRSQQQWQPGFIQPQAQQSSRDLNFKDWKGSDEARVFNRSEYSGQIKN
jgi:hypothetical protein